MQITILCCTSQLAAGCQLLGLLRRPIRQFYVPPYSVVFFAVKLPHKWLPSQTLASLRQTLSDKKLTLSAVAGRCACQDSSRYAWGALQAAQTV